VCHLPNGRTTNPWCLATGLAAVKAGSKLLWKCCALCNITPGNTPLYHSNDGGMLGSCCCQCALMRTRNTQMLTAQQHVTLRNITAALAAINT
jgi:hypothetical protein